MKPILYNRHSYLLDGKPIYLMSGEFHYFRVPKSDWVRRMRLFKAAGGNVLATYIPWLIHEPDEGRFVFSGQDWLDLEGFLQTAHAEGLQVIARPGPYQYSELVYDGLPGWLLKTYPQILARNIRGETFRESSVSYLHPVFIEKVKAWFDAVCPLLARYTVDHEGPIAFVQLDNEMVGIHEWFGTLDYHPDTMGFHREDGRYPRFLHSRYGQIERLNQAYTSGYAKFVDVSPADVSVNSFAAFRRRKDYYDFYVETIAEYSLILTRLLREHGIQTPVVHNAGNPGMNAHFLETARALGSQYLLGSDHYYNLSQDWPQNNPTPQYALRMFVSLEELRLMGYPPTVYELPGGSASDWPPVTSGDALACYMTNLALGMRGSNYYIFTGGPNPPGAGKTTDTYDFGAGIGAQGEVRPLYQAQVEFGRLIADRPWLSSASRPHDLRVGLDFDQARASYYWTEPVEGLSPADKAWNLLRQGALTASFCAGLSPTLVNLDDDTWLHDISTPLLVICSSSMAIAKQERLVNFYRNGGKILFMPVLPTFDENLFPCATLIQALGLEEFAPRHADQVRPVIAGIKNVNGVACFHQPPANAQVIGWDEFSGQPLAWLLDHPSGGRVAFIGLSWSYAMREQSDMLVAVLKQLGLHPVLSHDNPNLWVTYWEGNGQSCLFVLNLFTSPMQVEISLHHTPAAVKSGLKTGQLTIPPMTVEVIDL